ncbi:hypothetical protein DPMN_095204 [Dreissena polymorpha]|uniref:Uncharacterized protein n=1 Tax=Dreissena polymorpha TaxID=45954 RepID=A0A9D4R2I3_DREPO|nr:hypothetical protein DPMN_095204 [Dreissena polymorpha]
MATVSHEAYHTEESEIADVSRLHVYGGGRAVTDVVGRLRMWPGGNGSGRSVTEDAGWNNLNQQTIYCITQTLVY